MVGGSWDAVLGLADEPNAGGAMVELSGVSRARWMASYPFRLCRSYLSSSSSSSGRSGSSSDSATRSERELAHLRARLLHFQQLADNPAMTEAERERAAHLAEQMGNELIRKAQALAVADEAANATHAGGATLQPGDTRYVW